MARSPTPSMVMCARDTRWMTAFIACIRLSVFCVRAAPLQALDAEHAFDFFQALNDARKVFFGRDGNGEVQRGAPV